MFLRLFPSSGNLLTSLRSGGNTCKIHAVSIKICELATVKVKNNTKQKHKAVSFRNYNPLTAVLLPLVDNTFELFYFHDKIRRGRTAPASAFPSNSFSAAKNLIVCIFGILDTPYTWIHMSINGSRPHACVILQLQSKVNKIVSTFRASTRFALITEWQLKQTSDKRFSRKFNRTTMAVMFFPSYSVSRSFDACIAASPVISESVSAVSSSSYDVRGMFVNKLTVCLSKRR